MKYQEKKESLQKQIQSKFPGHAEEDSVFLEIITEKMTAEEFNKHFYKGEGATNSDSVEAQIALNRKEITKGLLRGLGVASYTILLQAVFKSKIEKSAPLGLIYALPSHAFGDLESLSNLVNFLDATLADSDIEIPSRYLVQSGTLTGNLEFDRIKVVPHIGAEILRLTSKTRISLIFLLARRTIHWLRKSIANPYFLLVGPEFIVDTLAIQKRVELRSDLLATTHSQLLAPALVFRVPTKAPRMMFWYSDNSMQISKQKHMTVDYTYLNQPLIDKHFVWTSSWRQILEQYNPNAVINSMGPVIFRNLDEPKGKSIKPVSRDMKVTIFDVTPKKFSGAHSIYSDEIMKNFLLDTTTSLEAKFPLASVRLKPKRRYEKSDSENYLSYVDSQFPDLEKLDWNCDIVREILNSSLVVCIPFTSPALISKQLGVLTIFYVPTSEYNLRQDHEGIPVLQGRNELEMYLENLK